LLLAKYKQEVGGGEVGLGVAVGEPLLDKHFWSRFDRARSSGMTMVGFVTNFINADNIGIERLLRNGPPGVAISFCPDRNMYERLFRNRCYDRVLANIRELLRLRSTVNPNFWVSIFIKSIGAPSGVSGTSDFKELQRHLPEVNLATMISNRYDNWGGRIASLPKGMHLGSPWPIRIFGRSVPCSQLFGLLSFLPNGSAVGCPCRLVLPGDDLCVGNIQDESFRSLWSRVVSLRNAWRQGVVPNCCCNCSMYMPVTIGLNGA
jgi:hypothetical protein